MAGGKGRRIALVLLAGTLACASSTGGDGGGGSSSGGSGSGSSSGGSGSSSSGSSSGGTPSITLPTGNAQFDYQISGAYTPDAGVGVVDRDRSDAPVAGKYNVCYVNAFQTQPEDATWWRTNHADLLLKKNGVEVVDEQWNEILLDISTAEKRTALLSIVGAWIDGCAAEGFQAVEPDNLDSWTRSQRLLTQAQAVEWSKLLAARAHAKGLAIAQKNTSEMLPYRTQIGFDFAIVEECQPYGDCDDFTAAYGNRWFEIEYPDNGGLQNYQDACDARGATTSIIYRDRQVVPRGAAGYVYESC
jgi:hypothetical protein